MTDFDKILEKITKKENQEKYLEVTQWVESTYPELTMSIKWSQPCYEKDGTFIISFAPFKQHIAVNLEKAGIEHFADKLSGTDYTMTDMTFRIKWNQSVDYDLLKEMIDFQIEDKKDSITYWRN